MNLVACIWLDGERIYFSNHAVERYQQRVYPASLVEVSTMHLRRAAMQFGRISLNPPEGVHLGRDLRDQYMTEDWLVIDDHPPGYITAFPLVCKPGGEGRVAMTCITHKEKP